MSARYGSLPGVARHYGTPGLGVLGAVVRANTATGLYGAGLLYNDWTSSADDTREMRALVTAYSTPAAPVVNEDGSIESWAVPADGTYTVTYQLYVDGVATGAPTTSSVLVGAPAGITATVAGAGTVTHTGIGAVVATVIDGSVITATVEVTGTVTHTGVGAVVASIIAAPQAPTESQVDFDLWSPFILPTVPGCPDSTMLHHVRQACIEFCERTGVWTESLAAITSFDGVADYTMTPPAGSAIVKLLSFTVSGKTADFVNQGEGERFRIEQSSCDVAWTPNRVSLSVSPTPGAIASTFSVKAALKPSQLASTIGNSVFEHYAGQIAAGALAGIYGMQGETWENAAASTAKRTLFEGHISKAALKVSFGFSRSRRRSAIRYF